jgi:molybdopterin converting factor small subunit
VVVIELYGVPRLRAGQDAFQVDACSLGEALAALGSTCPALAPSVVDGGRLQPWYLVAINGLHLTADPGTPLADGDVVVLLAADGGG